MATRNQVLSLFGASPEQIMQRQAQEQAQAIQGMQNPYQQVGAVIGTGLGRLFGGEDPEVTRQRELRSMLEGVNFENPDQIRQAASMLAEQFPDRALQLITMADELETRAQQRATSAAQQAQMEATASVRTVPYLVTRTTIDPLTQQPITNTVVENIEVPADQAQFYLDRFKQQTEGAIDTDSTPTARKVPENATTFKTVRGATVALIGDDYFIVTDEGNLGVKVDNIKELGGIVANEKPDNQKERREQVEQQIKKDRMAQPSTAAEDQLNPFSM